MKPLKNVIIGYIKKKNIVSYKLYLSVCFDTR